MSNFVYDNTSLNFPKSDLVPLTVGADPDKFIVSADWNILCQAVIDLRGALTSSEYIQFTEAASVPGGDPVAGKARLWVKAETPNVLMFTDDEGTDFNLVTGGGGLDDAYDSGGPGAGRTIDATDGAVVIQNTEADTTAILELNKSPSGAAAGAGLAITMGANATGAAVAVTNDGSGAAFTTDGGQILGYPGTAASPTFATSTIAGVGINIEDGTGRLQITIGGGNKAFEYDGSARWFATLYTSSTANTIGANGFPWGGVYSTKDVLTGAASSGATPPAVIDMTCGAHTTVTASTEFHDVDLNLTRTVQWATGSFATQRFIRIRPPTVAFVGASTITDASTLCIDGPPIEGANATLTNKWALFVGDGQCAFDAGTENRPGIVCNEDNNTGIAWSPENFLYITLNSSAQVKFPGTGIQSYVTGSESNPSYSWNGSSNSGMGLTGNEVFITPIGAGQYLFASTGFYAGGSFGTGTCELGLSTKRWENVWTDRANVAPTASSSGTPTAAMIVTGAAHTSISNAEATDISWALNRTVQFDGGGATIALQRNVVIAPATYTAEAGAITLTEAYTVDITGGPVPGTGCTITNPPAALRVQAGAATSAAMKVIGQAYGTIVTLSYGANIATNAFLSNLFTVTLTDTTAQLDNPSNLVAGMTLTFVVVQDGTGGRALTFGTAYEFGDAGTPDISTMALNEVAVITCVAYSTTKLLCTASLGFSP